MDYQNVHLMGHDAFPNTRVRPLHECLVDPLRFAEVLLRKRNANQRPGYPPAVLAAVLVFRGLPSATYDPRDYARSMAQKAHWERDQRVRVDLRPLRYDVARDPSGKLIRNAAGHYTVYGKGEKGIDVLCALATVRAASAQNVNMVLLASHDTDLEPVIEEVRRLGTAKIEAFRWDSPDVFVYQLGNGLPQGSRPWVTKLDEQDFRQTWDLTPY